MPPKDLAEYLKPFRALGENPRVLRVVQEDPDCRTIAAAWELVPCTWQHPQTPPPGEPIGQWKWLWGGVSFDLDSLVEAAEPSLRDVLKDKLSKLMAFHVIYPDGSIAKMLQVEINRQVRESLEASKIWETIDDMDSLQSVAAKMTEVINKGARGDISERSMDRMTRNLSRAAGVLRSDRKLSHLENKRRKPLELTPDSMDLARIECEKFLRREYGAMIQYPDAEELKEHPEIRVTPVIEIGAQA